MYICLPIFHICTYIYTYTYTYVYMFTYICYYFHVYIKVSSSDGIHVGEFLRKLPQ